MSNRKIAPEQLSRYIEGELNEDETRRVETILAESTEARAQLESLRKMLMTLGRLPDLAPPPDFLGNLEQKLAHRRSFWKRLAGWLQLRPLPVPARAAVFATVILGTWFLLWPHGVPRKSALPSSPATIAKDGSLDRKPMTRLRAGQELKDSPDQDMKSKGVAYLDSTAETMDFADKEGNFDDFALRQETIPPAKPGERGGIVAQPAQGVELGLKADQPMIPGMGMGGLPASGMGMVGPLDHSQTTAGESRERFVLNRQDSGDLFFSQDQRVPASAPVPAEAAKEELSKEGVPLDTLASAVSPSSPEYNAPVQTQSLGDIVRWNSATIDGSTAESSQTALELALASDAPRQTAAQLESWFTSQGWNCSSPDSASATEEQVIEVWVPEAQVNEATQIILAWNAPVAGVFAGQTRGIAVERVGYALQSSELPPTRETIEPSRRDVEPKAAMSTPAPELSMSEAEAESAAGRPMTTEKLPEHRDYWYGSMKLSKEESTPPLQRIRVRIQPVREVQSEK